jgi:uncharacterized membrane protein
MNQKKLIVILAIVGFILVFWGVVFVIAQQPATNLSNKQF